MYRPSIFSHAISIDIALNLKPDTVVFASFQRMFRLKHRQTYYLHLHASLEGPVYTYYFIFWLVCLPSRSKIHLVFQISD